MRVRVGYISRLSQAAVAVADGSVLTASEVDNPDLYWAIHGGGSNFGVVVEFQLKLHEQRATVFAGTWIYPAPLLDKLAVVTQEWWKTVDDEAMIHVYTRGPEGMVSIDMLLSTHEANGTFRIALCRRHSFLQWLRGRSSVRI